MRNFNINIMGLVLMASLFLGGCNTKKSLQVFIVDQQEKSDVISVDVPASSMLSLNDKIKTKEDLAVLKTLKKAIVLAYQVTDQTKERYLTEVKQVKGILKQEKYAELMRFGKGSSGARVYVIGEEEMVDEIIIFANDHTKGWLLVRVLGKAMNPSKMIELMKKVDLTSSGIDFSKLENLSFEFEKLNSKNYSTVIKNI